MTTPDPRRLLAAQLTMHGQFDHADALAYAQRLTDAQVRDDIAWHDWEHAQYVREPSPARWSPAVQQQVAAHYTGAPHFADPAHVLAMFTAGPETPATPPTAPASGTTKVILALGVVAIAALAGWRLAKD